MDLSLYYTKNAKDGGLDLTVVFYDLSLKEKCSVIVSMDEAGLLQSERTLYRLGSALLQHSKKKDKSTYPCHSIHELSRKARLADAREGSFADKICYLRDLYGARHKSIPLDVLVDVFEVSDKDVNSEND